MKHTASKEGIKPKIKSRSITCNSKQQLSYKESKDTKRTIKTKSKGDVTTILKKSINKDERLKTIMTKTLNLLRTEEKIRVKSRKEEPKDLIDMAEDIHSLVSSMMKKQNQKSVKKSDSFITERDKSLNRDSLLKYFQTKLGGDLKDEQSIQKRLKDLHSLKRSQGIATKYQSQSISSSDLQNYHSVNERKPLVNITNRRF